ncbi:MAG: glycoside hydrolase family 25 protein [Lachnospiraceae bacterium]|nr:glycoside hydrolase family 25 protein [Lachnospiraceae bacterium]
MSMLHDDDWRDSPNIRLKFAIGCVISSLAILLVLGITLAANSKNRKPANASTVSAPSPIQRTPEVEETEENENDRYRTADDLNFWHAYDPEEKESASLPPAGFDRDNSAKKDDRKGEFQFQEQEDTTAPTSQEEERKKVSANRFDVNELKDGEAEFADIIGSIPENPYFEEGFLTTDKGFKEYALNGRKSSYAGIDVSEYQKNIDWIQVAESGIDFAMVRVGSRGYQSGKLTVDDRLQDNLRGCSENGIKIGLYFYSQAINEAEAMEEAMTCVLAAGSYPVEYPIVFDSESVLNDSSRTENLTKEQLSNIAKAFCDTVAQYGYSPMIGATKKQFATKMDLSIISAYDWWLFDTDESTVFPYRFKMWQYSHEGKVGGIADPVNIDISFVDYSNR